MRIFEKNFQDNKNYIKAIILGVVSSVCIACIIMCIMAAILTFSSLLPYEYLAYIMILILCVSVFFGGYIASRISKSKGLILGLINGIIVFSAIALSGVFVSESTITYITLIKFIAITICSMLGGIKGVNKKEKIHIR